MIQRRTFIRQLGRATVLGAVSSTAWSTVLNSQTQDPPAPTPQQWMTTWMKSEQHGTKSSLGSSGALIVQRFADPIYFLRSPISWNASGTNTNYAPFTVPEGFVTDLPSVPPVFWSVLRPDGDYAYAAILHDYLYWTQKRSKDEADNILRVCMEEFRVKPLKVTTIYEGVHKAGGSAWNQNTALRTGGESRFLKQYPVDPKIRWAEWKSDPGHLAPNPA